MRVNLKEAGDCFGEVSLLYTTPRSATVAATLDSVVWVLERENFRCSAFLCFGPMILIPPHHPSLPFPNLSFASHPGPRLDTPLAERVQCLTYLARF